MQLRVLRSEGPAGGVGRGVGGSVGGGGLNGFVRHDSGRELLLSLLETSAGGTIQRMHLERREAEPVSEATVTCWDFRLPSCFIQFYTSCYASFSSFIQFTESLIRVTREKNVKCVGVTQNMLGHS